VHRHIVGQQFDVRFAAKSLDERFSNVGQHEHANRGQYPWLNGVGASKTRRDVKNVGVFSNQHHEVRHRRIEVILDRCGMRAGRCGWRGLRACSPARHQNDGDARPRGRSDPWLPDSADFRVDSGCSIGGESLHDVEYADARPEVRMSRRSVENRAARFSTGLREDGD
jgi:hypothetical protein